MPRQENLTVVKAGLSRQRTKGAAIKGTLYDLLNGYVTTEKTIKVRPGTTLAQTLTAGTKGLVHFDGKFHVFASASVAGLPADYTLHILRAPTANALTRIHFAEPFLGALYVVAEFAADEIFHYWLKAPDAWEASKVYDFNDRTVPAVDDGFVYKVNRLGDPNPVWTSGAPRAVDDRVEPTTPNGLYFQVTSVFGTQPISGLTEPDWADAKLGQQFIDTPDGIALQSTPTPARPPRDRPPAGTRDRYTDRDPD